MSFDEETRDSAAAREAQVGLPARRAAIELLSAVIDKKQPLDDILSRSLATGWMFDLPQRDRALARAIVATSLRRRGEIDRVLDTFLERGLPDKAGKLYPILLSGAAQLLFLKTPPHAAIDLAVRLAQWDSRARRYDKLVMLWNPDEVTPTDIALRLEHKPDVPSKYIRLAGHEGSVRSVSFSPISTRGLRLARPSHGSTPAPSRPARPPPRPTCNPPPPP